MIEFRDESEDEFPLGDGTAQTGAEVGCPYCGAMNSIALDPGSGSYQEYIEDCQVCCRPWQVTVTFGPDGQATVNLETADEA